MNEFLLKPKKIQAEISSMCNALCLGCHRTNTVNYNEVKSCIPDKKIVSTNTIISLLKSKVMETVEEIDFCGTIDEPLMHPDFFSILEQINKFNATLSIQIHTNGSLRSRSDWASLSGILQQFKSHCVHFSIDGLSGTHEFYRQKTDFEKIIANATSFIRSGGTAVWQFLVFPWNKHQIDEAEALSKELGFKKFHIRKDRSHVSKDGKEMILRQKEENKKTNTAAVQKFYGETVSSSIECNSQKNQLYFLSHDSRLWPCCFLSNGFFMSRQREFLEDRLYKNYGLDFNDLTKKTADEIVNGPFFRSDLLSSFKNSVSTERRGKITRCIDTCAGKNPVTRPQVKMNINEIESQKERA